MLLVAQVLVLRRVGTHLCEDLDAVMLWWSVQNHGGPSIMSTIALWVLKYLRRPCDAAGRLIAVARLVLFITARRRRRQDVSTVNSYPSRNRIPMGERSLIMETRWAGVVTRAREVCTGAQGFLRLVAAPSDASTLR